MADKIFFQLRLDADIHTAIKSIAEKEMRSLNAQIEFFLSRSVEWYNRTDHSVDLD